MEIREITTVLCNHKDLDTLAVMNKQLIEDEKSDNQMTIPQLKNRMKEFIEADYKAYFFVLDDEIVGYALINICKSPFYLRQFFICREYRRKHYGKKAFTAIMKELNTSIIDIEVLTLNEVGQSFWRSMGFKERSIYMRCDTKVQK